MSTKNKRKTNSVRPSGNGVKLSAIDNILKEPEQNSIADLTRRHWRKAAVCAFILLFGLGVFAKKGWLPHTDNLAGKKTGWFGRELSKHSISWNPFALALATPTPQLTKEYIYAGSRLLASIDAGASEIPPTDLAVWRPSTPAGWYIYNAETFGEDATEFWGQAGDTPVQGDYDGDGKTDFAVARPTASPSPGSIVWWVTASSGLTISPVTFGIPGDVPEVADYDGDGKTDIAVWRSSDCNWYIRPSAAPANMITLALPNCTSNDVPAPADYDGDGKADIAAWRNSDTKFHWKNSSDSLNYNLPSSFGYSGDRPVCADYDGDGKANFALKHAGSWIILSPNLTSTTTTTPSWPYSSSDIPVQNDYDGDGKVDIAMWHLWAAHWYETPKGYWYILQSQDQTTREEQFGL